MLTHIWATKPYPLDQIKLVSSLPNNLVSFISSFQPDRHQYFPWTLSFILGRLNVLLQFVLSCFYFFFTISNIVLISSLIFFFGNDLIDCLRWFAAHCDIVAFFRHGPHIMSERRNFCFIISYYVFFRIKSVDTIQNVNQLQW